MLRVWLIALLVAVGCDAPPPTSAPSPTTTQPTVATTTSASARSIDRSDEGQAAGISYLVRYSGGASAGEKLPLVLAIHGLGDRPSRFGLMRGFPAKARMILPRGIDKHGAGFSWFPIRVRGGRDVDKLAAAVETAADKLAAMMVLLTERYPTRGKPIVTGFSQGGMLSFALAARHPGKVALAVPVSGWLPAPFSVGTAPDRPPPLVALHGDADQILRIGPTRDSVTRLRDAGFQVELIEYPGVPHTVSPAMRRELFRRIAEATKR
jgi:phospholipase/carboxylesterase